MASLVLPLWRMTTTPGDPVVVAAVEVEGQPTPICATAAGGPSAILEETIAVAKEDAGVAVAVAVVEVVEDAAAAVVGVGERAVGTPRKRNLRQT
mmetsp:Transcript_11314/g.21706  ORF Transcript_11314/g.21706 Transcript_11314/m.21706 type:complete len:95 (-) Transcript_11314:593-877(-)